VPQLGRGVGVLRVVSRHLVLTHMVAARGTGCDGKRVERDRLRTVWFRRLRWSLCPPTLARRLVLGWRRDVPGGSGRRGLLRWRLWWLLTRDGGELWRFSSSLALFLPVRSIQDLIGMR